MTDDQLLQSPVIVLGSPRSGTTALGEMLQVHSTLHGLVEPRLTWRYGNDRKSDRLLADDATPPVIEHIRRTFAKHVREGGAVRLLEKTPSNALRIDFVLRVFPDAKIIHVMRDGVEASLSIRSFWQQTAYGVQTSRKGVISQRWKELQLSRLPFYAVEAARRFSPPPLARAMGRNLWGPRLPGMRAMLRDLDLLEVCALQWRTCVELARHAGARLSTDQYCEIKLEELTLQRFEQLLEFAGLEKEPGVLGHFADAFQPDLCRGRKGSASAEEIEAIQRWIAPTMQWLGY